MQRNRWRINSKSIYKFGREERLQLAYEMISPTEEIKLQGERNAQSEACSNRSIRQSVK